MRQLRRQHRTPPGDAVETPAAGPTRYAPGQLICVAQVWDEKGQGRRRARFRWRLETSFQAIDKSELLLDPKRHIAQ